MRDICKEIFQDIIDILFLLSYFAINYGIVFLLISYIMQDTFTYYDMILIAGILAVISIEQLAATTLFEIKLSCKTKLYMLMIELNLSLCLIIIFYFQLPLFGTAILALALFTRLISKFTY